MSEEKIPNNKRKRAQNFSESEKLMLINLIQQHKHILENEKSDAVTSKDKDKCWKMIEHLFNSRSSGNCRNSEVLKSCWDNLKKKTRKFFADEKMQLYKTGGGPYDPKSDVILEHVREIIKPSVDGLTNNYDSDDITDNNINSCKLPCTNSNKNLNETTSDMNCTMIEWLDENDNTDNSMHENDVLNLLKKQSTTGMEKEYNVSNIHTTIENDIENDNDENQNLELNKNNLHNIKSKRQQKRYKKEEAITSKISQYNILGDSKIELVQFMIQDLKTKSDIEIDILKTQLQKEKLEVQILQKELELKENMLQNQQQKLMFNV